MNHANRCAIVAVLAGASLAPVAATGMGLWPGVQPLLPVALAGLALTGLLFHCLLVRHLGAADTLARAGESLEAEQLARERAEQSLAETSDALCQLIRQQEQVRDTERQRIARDIHDDLGQHLLALKIELQLARHGDEPQQTPAPAALARLADHVDRTIASLRTVIDNLRPQALDDGLQVAMEHHLSEFSRLNGIGYQLITGEGGAAFRHRDLDVVLLRILRESLANVVRHAQASEVWVALKRSDKGVTLEIRDNGIGMARTADNASHGCGLAGIADRVAAAGGSFAIDSGPGAGTVLSMSIPLPQG